VLQVVSSNARRVAAIAAPTSREDASAGGPSEVSVAGLMFS
jgi:hypothetical protein